MYTTKEHIENYLLQDIDASFDSQVEAWISSITAYITAFTGRNFEADSVASARLFECVGSIHLYIDECIQITQVDIGDTYGESFETTTEYLALPLNDTTKTRLVRKNNSWPRGTHKVTAKWGYSATVPSDIQYVATVLVAGILQATNPTGRAKKRERIGHYDVEYTSEKQITDYDRVMGILEQRRRIFI